MEKQLSPGDLECLKGLAESPCPLVLHPTNAEPLIAAGFVERVAHIRWTGTTYRATPEGIKKAAEL